MATTQQPQADFVKAITRLDATALVVGSMIGSGIFIVSAEILREVHAPGLLLVVWAASGIVTLMGALTYGELAAMFPRAGGQYVYLRGHLAAVRLPVRLDPVPGDPDGDDRRSGRGVRALHRGVLPEPLPRRLPRDDRQLGQRPDPGRPIPAADPRDPLRNPVDVDQRTRRADRRGHPDLAHGDQDHGARRPHR